MDLIPAQNDRPPTRSKLQDKMERFENDGALLVDAEPIRPLRMHQGEFGLPDHWTPPQAPHSHSMSQRPAGPGGESVR